MLGILGLKELTKIKDGGVSERDRVLVFYQSLEKLIKPRVLLNSVVKSFQQVPVFYQGSFKNLYYLWLI